MAASQIMRSRSTRMYSTRTMWLTGFALHPSSAASVEAGDRVDSGGDRARGRSRGPEEARLGLLLHVRVPHASTDAAAGHALCARRAQLRPRLALSLLTRYRA